MTRFNSNAPQYGCALIGGAGSTGSSLLRTLFNRHSAVFAGEELNFFNKEQYFQTWSKSREDIFRRGIWTIPRTHGWFEYSGNSLLHPCYMWSLQELKQLLGECPSIFEFAHRYFDRPLREHGKNYWIEKTPSNCYCFNHFLNRFKNGKVIHTVRDPYESVCSLMRRGMSPYFSAALWIYNTCAALAAAESPRYLLVRYEDLTSSPNSQIERICSFLELDYQDHMMRKSRFDTTDHTFNAGWRFSRNAGVSRPRPEFEKLEEALKRVVIDALSLLTTWRTTWNAMAKL
jgi:hypothetical protein